ncbi:hypothetical protein TTHERM_00024120 (macronuclear) [Tetrahymena thermophila SB210]|uniref:Uncharacterized protein n=1 Tax=Tetrahymena thermophila (strain SB210) TaxID=312017 RepID=Q22R69_TETTS|nr:hypothetical protein TTHERM_00024120 [Tetrahymena thermophila SB210]EAR88253.2 hypothetical protein TTHERM_00024120 [Tetrahymena thermophila SB210]|eukprot:XP_001008498.2 hypothetical protein TTHERM_00024120 [Tetrahymena thermophila SB210]
MSSQLCETLNELGETNSHYLKSCLKAYKPHFVVEYFEEFQKSYFLNCNYDDDCIQEYRRNSKMRYIKVFDQKQNVKKLLVIFHQKCIFQHDLIILNEIFNSTLKGDLILNLYDSYFLDPEGSFYVFETEYYDLNSEVLSQDCNVPTVQIEKIMKKQLNHIFQLLGCNNQDYQASVPIYVNLISENQIQVKLNIFDFFEQIQTLIIEKPYYYIQNTQKNQEVKQMFETIKIDENLISIINKQLSNYEQNAFLPYSNQNFFEKIQQISSKDKLTHSLRIFEVISQHQQYKNFEILSLNKNPFELKLTKRNKSILLIGIKFKTALEAQATEKEYLKLNLLQGKFKSNLIDTQVFELECCNYLLLEFEYKNYDTQQFQSMTQLILKNQANGDDEKGTKDRKAFDFLQKLIEISYELYTKYNIKITNVDPDKILVQQQNVQQNIDVFIINTQSLQNYTSEYIKLISKSFEILNFNYSASITFTSGGYTPDIHHYYKIVSFFEMISNSTIENAKKIQISYNNIRKMLEILAIVIEENQNGYDFQLRVCQNNPYKLSIDFSYSSSYYHTQEKMITQLKKSLAFLIKNQEIIQKLEFKTIVQSQFLNLNNSQSMLNSSQLQQDSLMLLDKKILEEIGLKNTLGYNSYNIGLSVCQYLKNLQILSLEFRPEFNFNIVNQDSNFLRLSEQIISLELNFQSNNENIINLISQLQQYKNLNTLHITISDQYIHIKKLKQLIKKNQRLVLIQFKFDWFANRTAKIDNTMGFFF